MKRCRAETIEKLGHVKQKLSDKDGIDDSEKTYDFLESINEEK